MVNLFTIKTRDESEIGIYDDQLAIFESFDAQQNLSRVVGFFIENVPNHIFVCSLDKKNIKIGDNPYTNSIMPLGWGIGYSGSMNSMHSILNYNWISFPPVGTIADIGSLRVNENINKARLSGANLDWEDVKIVPFDEAAPTWIEEAYIFLTKNFHKEKPLECVIQITKSNMDSGLKKILMNAMYDFLGDADINKFSTYLSCDNDVSRSFFSSFSDDFWVNNSIYPCISWMKTRFVKNEVGGILHCGTQFDFLQDLFEKKEFCSIFHAISFYIRNHIIPSPKTCVVTTVRNEGPYIIEWISWYKLLGFDHIFIYANDNDDGSTELLEELAKNRVITLIKNEMGPGVRPQAKVCVHMFSTLTEILDYEWALVVDADEFIALNRYNFNNINEYIKWICKKNTDAIAINWKYMCSDDRFNFRDSLVTDRKHFIQYHIIGDANHIVKSMSRPNKMMSSTAHNSVWPTRKSISYRLSHGPQHRYAHNLSGYSDDPMWADESHHDMIYILHYHYKSSEELLLRLYRGDVLDRDFKKDIGALLFQERTLNNFIGQFEKHGETAKELFFVDRNDLINYMKNLVDSLNLKKYVENILSITEDRIEKIRAVLEENHETLGERAQVLHGILKKDQ